MVMIWRQPFAKMIGLAMAGSVWCFGLGLVAWEPVDPWRSAKSLEDQRPRDIRLPSPQRGRGAGGEGDRRCDRPVAFLVQQTSSAFAAELPQFATPPHPQPLSPSREARGAEVSMQLLSFFLRTAKPSCPNFLLHWEFPLSRFQRQSANSGKNRLGERLFFDRSLSSDESTSCASCHNPEHAFADNEVNSRGIDRKKGNRNTPSVINAAFQPYQFWDGRASSLEDQALLPLENPLEMGSSISEHRGQAEPTSRVPRCLSPSVRVAGDPPEPCPGPREL